MRPRTALPLRQGFAGAGRAVIETSRALGLDEEQHMAAPHAGLPLLGFAAAALTAAGRSELLEFAAGVVQARMPAEERMQD